MRIISTLMLAITTQITEAANCFDTIQLPRLLGSNSAAGTSLDENYYTSMTGFDEAPYDETLYLGGMLKNKSLWSQNHVVTDTVNVITRMNMLTNSVEWSNYYFQGSTNPDWNGSDKYHTITALALSPDNQKLVAYGTSKEYLDTTEGSKHGSIFTVDTQNGLILSNSSLRITLNDDGQTWDASSPAPQYSVYSRGMKYGSTGVFLAFDLVKGGFEVDEFPKVTVGFYDSSATPQFVLKQQRTWLGKSVTVSQVESGSEVVYLLGGSNAYEVTSGPSADENVWSPAIHFVTQSLEWCGTINLGPLINESIILTPHSKNHYYINYMAIDTTLATPQIFGTMHTDQIQTQFIVFKLPMNCAKPDTQQSSPPIESNQSIFPCTDAAALTIEADDYGQRHTIKGIRSKLGGTNGNLLDIICHRTSNAGIMFFQVDFNTNQMSRQATISKTGGNIEDAFFLGSSLVPEIHSFPHERGFAVGYFDGNVVNTYGVDVTPIIANTKVGYIISTSDENTCVIAPPGSVVSKSFNPSFEYDSTVLLQIDVKRIEVLADVPTYTPAGEEYFAYDDSVVTQEQPSEFSIQGWPVSLDAIPIEEPGCQLPQQLITDVSSATIEPVQFPLVTPSNSLVVTIAVGCESEAQRVKIPFTPPEITNLVCDDTPPWTYTLYQGNTVDSIDDPNFQIAINTLDSMIEIKTLSNPILPLYSIKLKANLLGLQATETVFIVQIELGCAPTNTLDPFLPLPNQTYAIGQGSQDFGFTAGTQIPSCTASYFVQGIPSGTWMTPIDLGVSVDTADLTHVGTYTILVYAFLGCSSEQGQFDLEVIDLCNPPTTVTPSVIPDITYYVGSGYSDVFFDPFVTDPTYCSLTYSAEISPPTGYIPALDSDTRKITIYEFDTTNVGTHTYYVNGIQANGAPSTVWAVFTLTIISVTPLSLINSIPLPDSHIIYDAATIFSWNDSTPNNVEASLGPLTWTVTQTPLNVFDVDIFQVQKTITLYSEDITHAGNVEIVFTVDYLNLPGVYFATETHNVMLEDNCSSNAVITAPQTPYNQEYTLNSPAITVSFGVFEINPTYCPIVHQVDKIPIPSLAPGLLTLDEAARTITIYTTDVSNVGIHNIVLWAETETGTNPSISLQFQLTVNDVPVITNEPTEGNEQNEGNEEEGLCNGSSLIINPAYIVSFEYNIGYPRVSIFLDPELVETNGNTNCTVAIEIIKSDDSACDQEVFTHYVHTNRLEVETKNLTKAGFNELKVKAYIVEMPAVNDELDFKVTVINPCLNANLTVTNDLIPVSLVTYHVLDVATDYIFNMKSITSTETVSTACPDIVLELTDPNSNPIDDNLFKYHKTPEDSATDVLQIYSDELLKVGSYTIHVYARYDQDGYKRSTDSVKMRINIVIPFFDYVFTCDEDGLNESRRALESSEGSQTRAFSMIEDSRLILVMIHDWLIGQQVCNNERASRLYPKVDGITETGELTIQFSNQMIVPPHLQSRPDGNMMSNFKLNDVIRLRIVSSQHDIDSEFIQIDSYNVLRYVNRTLSIQVNFKHPDYISLDVLDKDMLLLDMIEPWFFQDIYGQTLSYTFLSCEIDRQYDTEELEELLRFEMGVETVINGISWFTLIFNLLMSQGLKYMWSTINAMQFIVFISDWQLGYPKYGHSFLKFLKNLALMEFLPKEQMIDELSKMLGLDENECETCDDEQEESRVLQSDSEVEQQNQTIKIGSKNLVRNLGIMLVIAIGIIVLTLLFKLMQCLLNPFVWFRTQIKKLKDKIFFNLFIRYILQSTLKVLMAACTTVALTSWDTTTESAQGAFAIGIIVLFWFWPIIFASVMYQNYSNLGTERIKTKIGTMYPDVLLKTNHTFSLSLTIVFLLRRFLFVLITFTLYDHPVIQIQLFILNSIFYIIYLGSARIFSENSSLQAEYFNESLCMVVCYHLILFNNFLDGPDTLEYVGFSMIFCIILLVTITMTVMVITSVRGCKRSLYLKQLKKQRQVHDRIISKLKQIARPKRINTSQNVMFDTITDDKASLQINSEGSKGARRQLFQVNEASGNDIEIAVEVAPDYDKSELKKTVSELPEEFNIDGGSKEKSLRSIRDRQLIQNHATKTFMITNHAAFRHQICDSSSEESNRQQLPNAFEILQNDEIHRKLVVQEDLKLKKAQEQELVVKRQAIERQEHQQLQKELEKQSEDSYDPIADLKSLELELNEITGKISDENVTMQIQLNEIAGKISVENVYEDRVGLKHDDSEVWGDEYVQLKEQNRIFKQERGRSTKPAKSQSKQKLHDTKAIDKDDEEWVLA